MTTAPTQTQPAAPAEPKLNKEIPTPFGKLVWPNLHAPNTRFEDEGVYDCRIHFKQDDPEFVKFRAVIDQLHALAIEDQRVASGKPKIKVSANRPYKEVLDSETDEPTGYFEVKGKRLASGINKKTKEPWTAPKPRVFDSKMKQIDARIGSGSIGRMILTPYSYTTTDGAGLAFRLGAVQIKELKEQGGDGADLLGQVEGYVDETSGLAPSAGFNPEDATGY